MKNLLLGLILFTTGAQAEDSFSVRRHTLELPYVMDSSSVQAVLKELLYKKLEEEGPSIKAGGYKLSGNHRKVVLEDANAKIECGERSEGMLAVQTYGCSITVKAASAIGPKSLTLSVTSDSASVQAILKVLLFEKLDKEGPQTKAYRATLTGDYNQVELEDNNSSVVCAEGQVGFLEVQQFECIFNSK